MQTELLRLEPGKDDLQPFLSLPGSLYEAGRNPSAEGPVAEHLSASYVLLRNGTPAARLALYKNPDLYYKKQKAAAIGHYECADDLNLSARLLDAVEEELVAEGYKWVIGPMNGSTWENYRFSLDHDAPPFFLEPYHHLYYNEQFRDYGFELISQYISGFDTQMEYATDAILQREKELREEGVCFRNVDLSRFEEELRRIHIFSMEAFRNNFLYTPIRWEHFREKYLRLLPLLKPEHILLAEGLQGDLAGLLLSLDDLYNKKEKSLILKTFARGPKRQYRGLGNILARLQADWARSAGYASIIHAFMIDSGASRNLSLKYKGEAYKRYGLYGKRIG
jgi:hypothetical protein